MTTKTNEEQQPKQDNSVLQLILGLIMLGVGLYYIFA